MNSNDQNKKQNFVLILQALVLEQKLNLDQQAWHKTMKYYEENTHPSSLFFLPLALEHMVKITEPTTTLSHTFLTL